MFAEAARLDKALEIDCYPDRQDLNVELLKIAREHGTRISLGTDAHHPWQLEFIELGLAAALRAKLSAEQIVNFVSAPDVKGWIEECANAALRQTSSNRLLSRVFHKRTATSAITACNKAGESKNRRNYDVLVPRTTRTS